MNRRPHLRASDADRDEVVERLRKAAAEGRIVSEELEQRVSRALKARTYGELEDVVSDLPGPRSRRLRREPEPQRAPARRSTVAAGWALTVVRQHPALLIFAIPVVAVTAAMVIAATVMWATLMVVVMVLGGRPRPPAPWMYGRRRMYGPPRPRRYWA